MYRKRKGEAIWVSFVSCVRAVTHVRKGRTLQWRGLLPKMFVLPFRDFERFSEFCYWTPPLEFTTV